MQSTVSKSKSKDLGTITKQALALEISKAADLDLKASVSLVNGIIEEMTSALSNGEDVLISGFGKFVRLDKKSRTGRNPLTGDPVVIKARKVVKLRASPLLKDTLASAALNGSR